MRICITGGSGFIGTNLVEYFKQLGHTVINIDKNKPRNPTHKPVWIKQDILDKPSLLKTVEEFTPSILIHLAARTDLQEKTDINGYESNIKGTENIIAAIENTPTISRSIFASSQLVCQLGYIPKNDRDYNPSTLYGESKVISENIIRSSQLQTTWTIVRPTSIWGPWFEEPYKAFFLTIAKNRYIHPGNIKILKQWGFVGNSVYQIGKMIQSPKVLVDRKTFYLADYSPVELNYFANLVQKAMGANPIKTLPMPILKTAATVGDLLKQIGWKNPPLTSFRLKNIVTPEVQNLEEVKQIVGELPYNLDEGIYQTAEWLKNYSKKTNYIEREIR